MAGGVGDSIPIPEQAVDARLSPAEVHDLVRERLGGLAGRLGLRATNVHSLAREMQCRVYGPGEIILPRGVRADCLGLVVRGQVAVHVGERAAARLVVVLLPGSSFGELMLAEGRPSHATLQALTRCEIRFLRRADLRRVQAALHAERQVATLWQLVRGGAFLLVLLLLVLVALSQPASRSVLALIPMGIGQWCSQQTDSDCAEPAWQAAASLAPADPNPRLALGTWYFKQGDIAAAERSFQAAQTLSPDLPEVYNNLGLIYARQGEHERAVAAFRRALELEPGIAAVENNLALSLQAIRAYDEALEHYQSALALGEPQTSTLVNMAIAYYEAGRPSAAVDAARQALAYDSNLAPAYTILGAVALESRRPREALPDLQRAVALDAGASQSHFYLGLAYKALDQPVEAVLAFERALANAGDEATRVQIRRHLQELYRAQEQSQTH